MASVTSTTPVCVCVCVFVLYDILPHTGFDWQGAKLQTFWVSFVGYSLHCLVRVIPISN